MSVPSASPDPMITQIAPETCAASLAKGKKPFGVKLPYEDDSADAEAYTREFIAAVNEGLASIERGDFITFEEFEKEFRSWITK
jgi:hypothetical protein